MTDRLTLMPNRRYAMTMYPGYHDTPYHSPITVERVTPKGGSRRELELTFVNHAYAAGVEGMSYDLRILKREATYLVADVIGTDRILIVEPLTFAWCQRYDLRLPDEWLQIAS